MQLPRNNVIPCSMGYASRPSRAIVGAAGLEAQIAYVRGSNYIVVKIQAAGRSG
jgi:hypothetical protein